MLRALAAVGRLLPREHAVACRIDGPIFFGAAVYLSGLQPQPRELLDRMGVLARLDAKGVRLFGTTEEAIAVARAFVVGTTAARHPMRDG